MDVAVSALNKLWAGKTKDLIPVEPTGKIFGFSANVHSGSVRHPDSYSLCTGGSVTGG